MVITEFFGKLFACGPFFPNNLLDEGDRAVLQPPLADFRGELERMKLVTKLRAVPPASGQSFHEQSAELELKDLSAALKREKVSSALATTIMQAHLAERMKLNRFLDELGTWFSYREWVYDTNGVAYLIGSTNPPPPFPEIMVTPGLPPEFALYFKGVIAWHKSEGWQPIDDWQQVLALPESERRFKSTWAAFMLAKYYEGQTNDWSDKEALKYYEQVRTLAKKGFADSSGLAVASIGNEARIYLHRKDYERAIELYLEQYAAGDSTALVSLRFSASAAIGDAGATEGELKSLAGNAHTRRIITAYAISRHPYNSRGQIASNSGAKGYFDGMDRWLAAVESAHVRDVESAEQFALAAYQADDMDAAQRWINRASRSPVAQWLQAKLDLRAGKVDAAARLLAKVSRKFPRDLPGANAPASFAQNLFVDVNPEYGDRLSAGRQSLGELGVLHLARREYVEALDALLRSGYWMDAAYVAERVLTTDELKKYVDRNWLRVSAVRMAQETKDWPDGDWMMTNPREQIRYLLARRLARDERFKEARQYYPAEWQSQLDALSGLLEAGRDSSLMPAKRGDALLDASFVMRTNGMELVGTELAPDWFVEAGDYEYGITWQQRETDRTNSEINAASADEISRAEAHGSRPEERWHYREVSKQLKIQAAGLYWDAAQALPDNTDETARLLVRGGTIMDRYDTAGAERYYKALVHRCGRTVIGQQADKLRWFPKLDAQGNLVNIIPWIDQVEPTVELVETVFTNGAGETYCRFPIPGKNYRIQPGDTLSRIARAASKLGDPVTVQMLQDANTGIEPLRLRVGRLVAIPGKVNKLPSRTSAKNDSIIQTDGAADAETKIETAISTTTSTPVTDENLAENRYIVHRGDSPSSISQAIWQAGRHVSLQQLTEANSGLDPTRLKIGQVLQLPEAVTEPSAGNLSGKEINPQPSPSPSDHP